MVSSGSSSKYMIVFWCVKDFSRIFVCGCHSFSFSSLLLCIYFHLYPLSSSPSLLSIHRTLGQRRGSWVCSFFFFFLILFYFLTLQYCIGFAIYQNESDRLVSLLEIHYLGRQSPTRAPHLRITKSHAYKKYQGQDTHFASEDTEVQKRDIMSLRKCS